MDDCSVPKYDCAPPVVPPKTNASPCIESMEKALSPIGNGGPKLGKKTNKLKANVH